MLNINNEKYKKMNNETQTQNLVNSAIQPGSQLSDCDCVNELSMSTPPNNNAREVIITPLDYGYLVKVGCQKFAISSVETLIPILGKYLKEPFKVENAWFQTKDIEKL